MDGQERTSNLSKFVKDFIGVRDMSLLGRICLAVMAVVFAASTATAGDEYQPDPLEFAPEEEVQCSWSKLRRQEYQNCLAKKRYFNAMSDKEKKKYNEEVEQRRIKDRIRRLERNQVIHPPYQPE